MKMDDLSRRRILAGGLATALFPTVAGAQAKKPDSEGGIGGTGIVALLTDFGSLIVGGTRVETDAQTVWEDAFGPVTKSAVQLGDALTVETISTPSGPLARRVQVTHPLIGQISKVTGDGRFVVNGITVIAPGGARGIGVGRRVLVAGIWQGKSVIASRVAPAPSGLDLIAGTSDRAGGAAMIGGVRITGPGRNLLKSDGYGTVIGAFDENGQQMIAQRTTPGRFKGTEQPLRRLVVEGYLEPTRAAPGHRISGLGHSFARNLDLASLEGQRVLFKGAYTGLFAAQTALVLPENSTRRRRLLLDASR